MNAHTALNLEPEIATEETEIVRLVICGSVDDGKSTLIGRLLYDAGALTDDQIIALERDSKTSRNVAVTGGLDYSLLVDGLEAEREQGITIDVATRHFMASRRSFIIYDVPGHEQYTRNMVTAASRADVAVILIDIRLGLLPQTRRHAAILALMGIKHIIAVANKIDMIGYNEVQFRAVAQDFTNLAHGLGITAVSCIPVSAAMGDNICHPSLRMPWWRGTTLLQALEDDSLVQGRVDDSAMRMQVQLVLHDSKGQRHYAGMISNGKISVGDEVILYPSRNKAQVSAIICAEELCDKATTGSSVAITFQHHADIARGDIIASPNAEIHTGDQFRACLIWLDESEMQINRPYQLIMGSQSVTSSVRSLNGKRDKSMVKILPAETVGMNDVADVEIVTDRNIAFESYAANQANGSFILVDRLTNNTVAAGLVQQNVEKNENIFWQEYALSREGRSSALKQKACVMWLTGLSGAGKSTIANIVEQKLFKRGKHTTILDGDNLRHGLCRDLGFSEADRAENIRRAAEVSRLMTDAGLMVIVSLISPLRRERNMARTLFENKDFIEIFVDAPLDVCEQRDPKGLYKKAREKKIQNFTGIDSPYEPPITPDIHLMSGRDTPEIMAEKIIRTLEQRGLI